MQYILARSEFRTSLLGYHLALVSLTSNENCFLGPFRRFQALYVSENLVPSGGEIDELVGHTYLYLKEQLERHTMPPSSILHGTIIGEVFCSNLHKSEVHLLFFSDSALLVFNDDSGLVVKSMLQR